MEKQQHTPGPWVQPMQANGANVRHPHIISDGGEIAITTWQGSEQKTNANARLIASAPDLLEALEEIVSAADGDGWSQIDADLRKARAAIAKATGG